MSQFEVGEKGKKKLYSIQTCVVDTAVKKRKCVMCEEVIIPKSKCVRMELTGLNYITPNLSHRSACISCGRTVLQDKEHELYEQAERCLDRAANYRAELRELDEFINRNDADIVASLELGKDGKYRPKED